MAEEQDMEEKMKMQKHELLAGFLELQTRREKQKTTLNEFKTDIQWRELMRAAKSDEIRNQLKHLKEFFLKTVDLKDSILSSLRKKVAEVEVENMRVACAHMEALEQLLAAGEQRVDRLRKQYIKDMLTLRACFKEVQIQLERMFGSQMTHFADLDLIEDEVFQDFKLNAKTRFSIMQKDINIEITKEKEDIIAAFDTNMNEVWSKFQSALVKYFEDADSMEKVFLEMQEQYEKSMQDTLQNRKITEQLQRSIPRLRARIEQREKDYKERVQDLLKSQEQFNNEVTDLKERMSKTKQHDKTSLRNLVVNSTAAIRELEKHHAKGERIMRLYRRCEKLEAEAGDLDAVLEEPCLTPEELEEVKKNFNFEFSTSTNLIHSAKNYEYVSLLQWFWEKINRVVLQNLALKREMNDLEMLHLKLKTNMDEFFKKVADDDLDSIRQMDYSHKPLIQEAALIAKGVQYHMRG